MKKLTILLGLLMGVFMFLSAQIDDSRFFVYKYQPGESSPETIISLGVFHYNKPDENTISVYNIEYKKNEDLDWTEYSLEKLNTASIEINDASTTSDIYYVRYQLKTDDKTMDVLFDFKDKASCLLDILQWGTTIRYVKFDFSSSAVETQKYASLVDISAPDTVVLGSFSFKFNTVFSGVNTNMKKWGFQNITNLTSCFQNASNFNGDISNWDMSKVTSFNSMFSGASSFNQDISGWNVGNAANLSSMFNGASSFNQNISGWNVSKATNLQSMFNGASSFNQNIGGWNVGIVTSFNSMFRDATSFNQDIGAWNVSAATTLQSMFQNASSFNQDIGGWNVSKATNFSSTFRDASSFNQDIGEWNMSVATNLQSMFQNASSFNQDIGTWNVSAATSLQSMFQNASSFNQDISGWNVGKVTSYQSMFNGASAFNQNLGAWTPSEATTMTFMFNNSGMSTDNYDNTLIGWWAKKDQLPVNIVLGANYVYYSAASTAARTGLETEKGWTIGGSLDPATNVESIKDNNIISVHHNRIVFSKNPLSDILVYNISGSLMETHRSSNIISTNLPSGVYIISFDGQYKKIIL